MSIFVYSMVTLFCDVSCCNAVISTWGLISIIYLSIYCGATLHVK